MPLPIPRTLLLVIDIQNDFCPAYTRTTGEQTAAGALAINRGDAVIEPLNTLAAALAAKGGRVAATQDWHPAGHVSFASSHPGRKAGEFMDIPPVQNQVLWPDHCVQGSWGAAFHEQLDLKPVNLIVRKGFRPGLDSYSAFFENDRKTSTGLAGWLRGLGVETLLMGGLATDYCVFYSAIDACNMGIKTIVLHNACVGVGYPSGSVEQALNDMRRAGISFASTAEIVEELR